MPDEQNPGAGFFILDARIWSMVTAVGMNEAVAYLVLACGTGRENKSTRWSTNAVMEYGGLGWERAKRAIQHLLDLNFIRFGDRHTFAHPKYEFTSHDELAEARLRAALRPDLNKQQRRIVAALEAGQQPVNSSDKGAAVHMVRLGMLIQDAAGLYRVPGPVAEQFADPQIWIPNTLVTGTIADEKSPLKRLRQANCVQTLKLLVELYAEQNLRDDGGIRPQLLRQKFDRREIGAQGPYKVWAFRLESRYFQFEGPFAAYRESARDSNGVHPLWQSISLLQNLGLFSFVPYLFDSDSNLAEPIHSYGVGGAAEVPIEAEISKWADLAGRSMALTSKLEGAKEEGFSRICPVLAVIPSVTMVGVPRLTYRPHTRRTSAWYSQLQREGPELVKTFVRLTTQAEAWRKRYTT